MLSRFTLALMLGALSVPLMAFYDRPPGYSLSEIPQTSGTSGVVWDPATGANDFYASHDGGIRRFDTALGAFSGTPLFDAPASIPPAGYAFFDALAIDPDSPDDFYVSYSGHFSRLHKLTRTGPDSSILVTSADYDVNNEFIFRLKFIPDNGSVPAALRGQLIAVAGEGFSGASGVYVVDKTTLALTRVIDVTGTQASGPITVDAHGNIYAVVPTDWGTPQGVVLYRFDAADVSAALTSGPVQPSQAQVLIAESDAEWNINDITAREEDGKTFLYYGTQEHASIYRMCVATGESRLFMRGFGGTADGFPAHSAQGGSIAFSGGDFTPAGGGTARLAIPFGVSTIGSGSYHGLYFVEPEPVNVAVDALAIKHQPGAVNDGVPFALTVEALNSSGTPILSNVAVVVRANGPGVLEGFTTTSQPGDGIILKGLVYTAASLPETITLTVEVAGNPGVNITSAALDVVAPAAELAVVQPGGVEPLRYFAATAELLDAAGATVPAGPDSEREVTVELAAGPGSLFGSTTVNAQQGVATFDSLMVDSPGTYTLRFLSSGLPPQTVNVTVMAADEEGGNGDDNDSSSGCTVGGGRSWGALMALLGGLVAAVRRRRARA